VPGGMPSWSGCKGGPRVHVQVVRRGGIAGVVLRGEVDTAELSGVGDNVERFLRSLPFGRRPAPARPDRFLYEITVTGGGRSRSAQFGETELPESLRPLVDAALAHGTIG
jgi:hypothetical protein